jgi:hypothetical protein
MALIHCFGIPRLDLAPPEETVVPQKLPIALSGCSHYALEHISTCTRRQHRISASTTLFRFGHFCRMSET